MNNVKQIYHTSHCGSTLLVTLLKSSIDCYSEPPWTHNVFREEINFQEELGKYKNSVIKLPSGWCCLSTKIEGKKIFLYRKLRQHLFKILKQQKSDYVQYYDSFFIKNIHPTLKDIDFNSFQEKNVFLWANRIMWMRDANDVKWIESNHFFKNKKKVINEVCDFFDIEKISNLKLDNIHAKSIGMLHQDKKLSDVEINFNNKIVTYPTFGVIDDAICDNSAIINELLNWTKNKIPFVPETLL